MNQDERITCVVPAYNSGDYIAEALDSILAQTRPPDEVVVVDDGSTDATPDIVASYRDAVRLIRQDDLGPAATRNRGIQETEGEFVAFLDADDVWLPTKLEAQLECFRADPSLDLCLTQIERFWEDPSLAKLFEHEAPRRVLNVPGYATVTLLARRSAFDRVGLLDINLSVNDTIDWFIRARRHGLREHVIPQALVRRREHECNLSRRARSKGQTELLTLLRNHAASNDDD